MTDNPSPSDIRQEDVREALEHLRHVKTARQRFKLGEYAVTNQITRARQSLLAALSSQPGEPVAWRSIETAPRDGRRILACGGGLERVEIVSYNGMVGCWDAECDTLDDRDDDAEGYNRPALWRPVPVAAPPPQPDTGLSRQEDVREEVEKLRVMLRASHQNCLAMWEALEGGPSPRCRECADFNGRCQGNGEACDPQERAMEKIKRLRAAFSAQTGEPVQSYDEKLIRAQLRVPLIKIAAECHRKKWQFSTDEETRLPAAEARGLVKAAFNVLHNIGEMAHKAAEAMRKPPAAAPPPQPDTAPSPLSTGEELVDSIAKWLHEETEHPDSYPDHTWPETDRDDGRREDGWLKIVPQHAQAYFRDIARRLIATFPAALAHPPATEQIRREVWQAALTDIVSWKHDVLGPPGDSVDPLQEAFRRGARMAFYRCADHASCALAATEQARS